MELILTDSDFNEIFNNIEKIDFLAVIDDISNQIERSFR